MRSGRGRSIGPGLVLALAAALLSGLLPRPVVAADNPDFSVERLAGADRYATAAAISRRFFAPNVPVAFVATGENFPDGLAAGPAAARLGGPVLFVRTTAIPPATATELGRLKPQRIVVVGSAGVVAESVREALAAMAPGGAERVAGADRYGTAAELARIFFPTAPVVYLATGELFPDALAGGGAAAVEGGAVLLTRRDGLPAATRVELERLRPARIVVLGSPGAISAAVEAAVRPYGGQVVRVAGQDRYGTAIAVSRAAFPGGAPAAFLATGHAFPDAVATVAVARIANAPILLVPGTVPTAGVLAELARLDPDAAYLLGSSAAVGVNVAKEAQRELGLCWSAYKPPAGTAQVLSRVANAGNQIALTFDMGGRLDPAVRIVDFLIDNQVCATIFPTGTSAQTAIGRLVMDRIAAHPELFEVGNHTMHHCNLRDGAGGAACPAARPSSTFVRTELAGAESVALALTGQSTRPYWRPPYGASDATLRAAAAAAGYTKTVMWHVDTIDWDEATTKELILSRVLDGAASGSIVLMHLGGYRTLDALPDLVTALRERGYRLTTISDMLD